VIAADLLAGGGADCPPVGCRCRHHQHHFILAYILMAARHRGAEAGTTCRYCRGAGRGAFLDVRARLRFRVSAITTQGLKIDGADFASTARKCG